MHSKMIPPPWRINDSAIVSHDGEQAVAYANEANSEAIIAAVNNTYGIGVNPEAVKDLVEALEAFLAVGNQIMSKHSAGHPLNWLFPGRFAAAQAAIQKAKNVIP